MDGTQEEAQELPLLLRAAGYTRQVLFFIVSVFMLGRLIRRVAGDAAPFIFLFALAVMLISLLIAVIAWIKYPTSARTLVIPWKNRGEDGRYYGTPARVVGSVFAGVALMISLNVAPSPYLLLMNRNIEAQVQAEVKSNHTLTTLENAYRDSKNPIDKETYDKEKNAYIERARRIRTQERNDVRELFWGKFIGAYLLLCGGLFTLFLCWRYREEDMPVTTTYLNMFTPVLGVIFSALTWPIMFFLERKEKRRVNRANSSFKINRADETPASAGGKKSLSMPSKYQKNDESGS